MRILVVNNLYPPVAHGGYEEECAEVVARLRVRHEVTVLTSRRGRRRAGREPGVLRELPLLTPDERGALRAPVASVRAAGLMRRLLDDVRPELVYVWNGAGIPHAALRVVDYARIPTAYRVCEHWFGGLYRRDQFMRHLVPGERGLRRGWALMVRAVNRHPALRLELARTARAAIAWNSESLRGLNPVPPTVEPVLERVIHSTTSRAAGYADLPRRPAPEPLIAFLGRVEEFKGPDVACRALAELRSRHGIPARLVLAGWVRPRMRRVLERLARELGVAGAVELPGPLDSRGVGELLQRAHALVVPSVGEEAAPLVCIEAALARVPVVASRSGGIPEILRPDEHALLFPIGDAGACADALARTLSDAAGTEARVRRAFERGRELSIEAYLDATERFVADAAAALGAPDPRGDLANAR